MMNWDVLAGERASTLTATSSCDYWALLLEFRNIPRPDQPGLLPGLDSEALWPRQSQPGGKSLAGASV